MTSVNNLALLLSEIIEQMQLEMPPLIAINLKTVTNLILIVINLLYLK